MSESAPRAVLVANRTIRTVPALAMSCDAREIPHAPKGSTTASHWLAFVAGFMGKASTLEADGRSVGAVREAGGAGTAAMCVTDDRLIAIVSPHQATSPAAWLTAPLEELTVTGKGVTGLLKKRPQQIELQYGDDWDLILGRLSRLYLRSSKHQTGKEGEFFAVCGGTAWTRT